MTGSETILVTGATGFIGAHCVGLLLEKNYHVKALCRSLEKYERLESSVPHSKRYLLEPSIASDITNYEEVVSCVSGCTGILHLASPFKYDVSNFVDELLNPALKGTEVVLKAASSNPRIKRVVVTSSFAAIYDASKGLQKGVVITESDFSPLTWEDGATTKDPAVAYRVSKVIAEKAAWDFMEQYNPSFDLSVICPTMVFGPLYSTNLISSVKDLNFSNKVINDLLEGSSESPVPPTRGPVWVDVRDLAESHIAALEEPAASNQRFLLSAGDFDHQQIADILRSKLPSELGASVPVGTPGERLTGTHFTTDSSKAMKTLGVTYRSLESCILDLATQLLKFGEK